jgi:hypothetical protein
MSKPNPDLTELGKRILVMTDQLKKDLPLDQAEQMFIENHLCVIWMAYAAWKRRNTQPEVTEHGLA